MHSDDDRTTEPRQFFLSYEEKSKKRSSLYIDNFDINNLVENCKSYYSESELLGSLSSRLTSESKYHLEGLTVTVYKFGMHRAIRVELPPTPSQKQVELFDTLLAQAKKIESKPYEISQHNCVTAVASILNTIDPSITSPKLVSPLTLDKDLAKLEEFTTSHSPSPTQDPLLEFMIAYERNERSSSFFGISSFFSSSESLDKKYSLSSLHDIFHMNGQRMTPTIRLVLLELNWVRLGEDRSLEVTPEAPQEFKEAFEEYHRESLEIQQLKSLFTRNGGNPGDAHLFFVDNNPDLKTIIERLSEAKENNPYCPAAFALKTFFESQQETPEPGPSMSVKM